jgi:hypothetical protein
MNGMALVAIRRGINKILYFVILPTIYYVVLHLGYNRTRAVVG